MDRDFFEPKQFLACWLQSPGWNYFVIMSTAHWMRWKMKQRFPLDLIQHFTLKTVFFPILKQQNKYILHDRVQNSRSLTCTDQPDLSRKYRLISTYDWSVGGKPSADWLVYVFLESDGLTSESKKYVTLQKSWFLFICLNLFCIKYTSTQHTVTYEHTSGLLNSLISQYLCLLLSFSQLS